MSKTGSDQLDDIGIVKKKKSLIEKILMQNIIWILQLCLFYKHTLSLHYHVIWTQTFYIVFIGLKAQ